MKKWNIDKTVANNWLQNRDIKIIWTHGNPTNTGRTDYFKIISFTHNPYNKFSNMTYFISQLCEFRYNEKSDCLSIGGYGYSKKDHIIESIQYALQKIECEINYSIE